MNERITFNSEQCGGRPCIRGLRIRVKDILDLLAAKVPRQEILEDFPYLEDEDIDACLQYAAAEAAHPVLATTLGTWTCALNPGCPEGGRPPAGGSRGGNSLRRAG